MPVVELDFYEPDGTTLIGTLDDSELIEVEARVALQELGAIKIRVSRHLAAASSDLLSKGNLVKYRVPSIDADPIALFVLRDDVSQLINQNEEGGEHLEVTGPGALWILQHARLREEVYAPGQPARGDWDEDISWNWRNRAYGSILTRVHEEGVYQPGGPLAAISIDFDRDVDSDGIPWAVIAEEFTVPIGTDLLEVANRLAAGGDLFLSLTPDMVLHAYQSVGRNLTGSFASDNVRFEKGVNILTELSRKTTMDRVTHLITRDRDQVIRTFATPSAFSQAVYGFLEIGWTNDPDQVEKTALEAMRVSDAAAESYALEITPGFAPVDGLYMPGPEGTDGHFWPGDRSTLHTGSGEHDLNAVTATIFAVSIVLDIAADDSDDDHAARSLHIVPELMLGTPGPAFSGSGSVDCPCVKIAQPIAPTPASCFVSRSSLTEIPTPNGDFETGTTAHWSGAVLIAGDPEGVGGSWQSGSAVIGAGGWYYEWTGSFPAGQTIVAYYWLGGSDTRISLGDVDNGDYTADQPGIADVVNCIEWTPSADRTVMQFHHARSGSGFLGGDNLQAYTGGSGPGDGHPDLVGNGRTVSRVTHRHDVHRDTAPSVSDNETIGYPVGTTWVQLDDLITPTEIVGMWIQTGSGVWLPLPTGMSESEVQDLIDDSITAHAATPPTAFYRPLMDGAGNVVTDGGTGAAIMAYE